MRNPYYENTDVKNRQKSGEDVLKTTEHSALRATINHVINGDTKTIYQVGFGLGPYLCVIKKLYPELKVYGCEFDPMFFNFAQAIFDVNTYVESVNLYNSFDSWKLSGSYDIVFAEAWVNTLDRNAKADTFKKILDMTKQVAVFEKLDLDFEYDKNLYTVKEQENGTVTVKLNPYNLVWGPELSFAETSVLPVEGKITIDTESLDNIKLWTVTDATTNTVPTKADLEKLRDKIDGVEPSFEFLEKIEEQPLVEEKKEEENDATE